MAKDRPIWVCEECGNEALQWSGRCEECQAWNTLKELRLSRAVPRRSAGQSILTIEAEPVPLVVDAKVPLPERLSTSLNEVDRVLGKGFFPGSVTLVAGEPGVGKSTLLLTLAARIGAMIPVLYVSGEESVQQIQARAQRLHISAANVQLFTTTDLGSILAVLERDRPGFVIIDSIQTVSDSSLPSASGSVVQVRESAHILQQWAKRTGATLLFVGHVTKEGVVAGPRTLEHLVDVVLYLEGERTSDLRLLRSHKNRFGPTDEVGILEMSVDGLVEITNPATKFIGTHDRQVPGSVVTVVMEGQRPILLEVQALVRPTFTAYPRRTAIGLEANRLESVIAVLEARIGLQFGRFDCYVSLSGGLKVREPATDLAVAVALASARLKRTVSARTVVFGEIGLTGEIRPVSRSQRRADEARRLGFDEVIEAVNLRQALSQLNLQPRAGSRGI